MPSPPDPPSSSQGPPEHLVRELMVELATAFDLSTPIGEQTLGEAAERRLWALELADTPEWGGDGSLTQVAREGSQALDFYYRPHLFPEMDPALRLGHHLQFDLLPRHLPSASPLRLAAVLESYCHLSGDLLGWRLEDDELFLWIADVCGHGVRAGLAAATLYLLIESIEWGLPPAVFAQRVNEAMLAAKNPADMKPMFATAVWLRAAAGGRVRYASCGHNPMLRRRSSGEVESLGATGMPVGLLPDQSYGEERLRLAPDDVLCLFTDGVVEATDPAGEEFGSERLAELRLAPGQSPMDLVRTFYRAVRAHQASNLFEDDLTLVVAAPAAAG